jgi:hypothetical protein
MAATGFVDRGKGKSLVAMNFYSVQTGIVASTTHTQVAAVPLTAQNCFLATVAVIGDSVKLPPAQAGMEITIINQAALAAATFPSGTDTINGGGAGASVALPTGNAGATPVVIFYCAVDGKWFSK